MPARARRHTQRCPASGAARQGRRAGEPARCRRAGGRAAGARAQHVDEQVVDARVQRRRDQGHVEGRPHDALRRHVVAQRRDGRVEEQARDQPPARARCEARPRGARGRRGRRGSGCQAVPAHRMKAPVMAATRGSCPTASSRRSVKVHSVTIGAQASVRMISERCSQVPTAA